MQPNAFLNTAGWLKYALGCIDFGAASGGDSPPERRLALQLLLAHVLQKPRAWIIAHPEAELTGYQAVQLKDLLARFAQGEPLPYLLGHWEFYGLDFIVSPATLIPRPETELLVERAITWSGQHPTKQRAADVGTGSGCIAVSLVKNVPDLRVLAVDRSLEALVIARQNVTAHHAGAQIHLAQGDLLTAAGGPFDLVCANLPYIPRAALAGLAVSRHEPVSALDGGADGLDMIRELAEDSPRWLAAGGLLLLEMQFDQGEAISAMLHDCLPDSRVSILKDLAGLPRVVQAERSE